MTTRALVLGGGGVAGIAWETGILAGLSRSGIDVTNADVVIGTSAGSAVAAGITSGLSIEELLLRQTDPTRLIQELVPDIEFAALWQAVSAITSDCEKVDDARRRFGELAIRSATVSEQARRAVIADRLPRHEWPDTRLLIPAVDADTGRPRIFTATSGVSLIDAVAASCAVPGMWPTVHIGDRRYLDGGIRSNENADLAAGFDRVLVLSVMDMPGCEKWGIDLSAQVAALRAHGSQVEVIRADAASVAAAGTNPLDPDTRTPSAYAGLAQGRSEFARVATLWT